VFAVAILFCALAASAQAPNPSSASNPFYGSVTTHPATDNVIRLSLTSAQVDALPASCWWTLTAGTATGVTTLCQGTVTITGP